MLPAPSRKLNRDVIVEFLSLDNLVTFFVPEFIRNYFEPYFDFLMNKGLT